MMNYSAVVLLVWCFWAANCTLSCRYCLQSKKKSNMGMVVSTNQFWYKPFFTLIVGVECYSKYSLVEFSKNLNRT